MKKLVLLTAMTFSLSSFAWSFFEMGNEERVFKNNRSHNQFITEVSAIEYTPGLDFQTEQKEIIRERQLTPGVMLGLAREMRITNGFSWTLGAGAFYNKSWKEEIDKASPNLDAVVSNYKRDTELIGGQVNLNINYQIETSLALLQPFFGVAYGQGRATTDVFYNYDLGPTSVQESYDGIVEEDFSYIKYGLGLNIIGSNGLFSYFSVYQNNYQINERSEKATKKENGGSTQIVDATKTINEAAKYLSVNIGVGYRF